MCLTVACAVIDLKGHFDLLLLRFCLATDVLCDCGLLWVACLLGGFGFLCGLHLFGLSCLLRFVSRFGLFWNDRLLEAFGWAQFHLGTRILLEFVFFLLVYRLHGYICWLSAVYAWFGTRNVEKSRGCKNAFCHGQARPRFRSYRMDGMTWRRGSLCISEVQLFLTTILLRSV